MTCAFCNEVRPSGWCALRPCSRCKQPVAVCYLCGGGKDSGAVSFDHGCEQQEGP